jgi:hypothetical protein
MPLPQAVHQLTGSPGFWADYLFLEDGPAEEYPTLDSARLDFDVCPGYRLTLSLDRQLSYHGLGFVYPGMDSPVEIGWDDQAHWHPNALRWEELDLVGRCLALNDPALPHPGLPVLLLNRFAPVCLDTDADAAFSLIESAWGMLRLFSGPQLVEVVERYDRRHAEFVWREEEALGWVLGQAEGAEERTGWTCYTLRSAEDDQFPFRQWGEFVTAAEQRYRSTADPAWLGRNGQAAGRLARALAHSGDPDGAEALADALEEAGCDHPTILGACRSRDPARFGWVLELLLGEPRGAVLRQIFGPTPRRRRTWYSFTIDWPEPPGRSPAAGYAGRAVAEAIRDALLAHGIGGSAAVTGATSDGQGRWRTSCISVSVRDELDRGIEVIRAALLAQDPPVGVAWRQNTPQRRQIPLLGGGLVTL